MKSMMINSFKNRLHLMKRNFLIWRIRIQRRPIRVVFFALDSNSWKYDSLIQAMLEDPLFTPLVLVVPQVNKGREFMASQLQHGFEYYKSKGYPLMLAYDEATDSFVNPHSLRPDLVFFCNPYDGLVDDKYNIRHFVDKALTCYVNYAFCNVPFSWSCASFFHQRLWKYYVECELNLKQVQEYYDGENCVVTGYPMSDLYRNTIPTGKDWKIQNHNQKRIIWAPHHTIQREKGFIQFSTFLLFYDVMLRIAHDYRRQVQFVFKPHPLLKPALYSHPQWGKQRTDEYYRTWSEGENTSYVNGDYVDLFLSSDAMIHDCGSFIIEYLYVQKPVQILGNFDRLSQSNEVGKRAYLCHYEGLSEKDIRQFIEDVIIQGKDPLEGKRIHFYQENLLPPHGKTVAQNIINDIKETILS